MNSCTFNSEVYESDSFGRTGIFTVKESFSDGNREIFAVDISYNGRIFGDRSLIITIINFVIDLNVVQCDRFWIYGNNLISTASLVAVIVKKPLFKMVTILPFTCATEVSLEVNETLPVPLSESIEISKGSSP